MVGIDLLVEVEQRLDVVGGIVGIPAQLDLHEECPTTIGDQVLGLRWPRHRRDTRQLGRLLGQVRGRGARLRRRRRGDQDVLRGRVAKPCPLQEGVGLGGLPDLRLHLGQVLGADEAAPEARQATTNSSHAAMIFLG